MLTHTTCFNQSFCTARTCNLYAHTVGLQVIYPTTMWVVTLADDGVDSLIIDRAGIMNIDINGYDPPSNCILNDNNLAEILPHLGWIQAVSTWLNQPVAWFSPESEDREVQVKNRWALWSHWCCPRFSTTDSTVLLCDQSHRDITGLHGGFGIVAKVGTTGHMTTWDTERRLSQLYLHTESISEDMAVKLWGHFSYHHTH